MLKNVLKNLVAIEAGLALLGGFGAATVSHLDALPAKQHYVQRVIFDKRETSLTVPVGLKTVDATDPQQGSDIRNIYVNSADALTLDQIKAQLTATDLFGKDVPVVWTANGAEYDSTKAGDYFYTVTATDSYGQTSTASVVIHVDSKESPSVTPGVTIGGIDGNGDSKPWITITNPTKEGLLVTVWRDGTDIHYKLGEPLTEPGNYHVLVADLETGNSTNYYFTIEAPEVEPVPNEKSSYGVAKVWVYTGLGILVAILLITTTTLIIVCLKNSKEKRKGKGTESKVASADVLAVAPSLGGIASGLSNARDLPKGMYVIQKNGGTIYPLVERKTSFGWTEYTIANGLDQNKEYEFVWVGGKDKGEKTLPSLAVPNHGYTLEGKADSFFKVENALRVWDEKAQRSYNYVNEKSSLRYVASSSAMQSMYVRFYDDGRWCVIYAK